MKVDLVIENVDTKDWYYIFIVHKDKKIKPRLVLARQE